MEVPKLLSVEKSTTVQESFWGEWLSLRTNVTLLCSELVRETGCLIHRFAKKFAPTEDIAVQMQPEQM